MPIEYVVIAFVVAIIAFVVTYMWLYNKYRNVSEKYEVVKGTESETIEIDVVSQFKRKRKGLSNSRISGDNTLSFTSRVGRIPAEEV